MFRPIGASLWGGPSGDGFLVYQLGGDGLQAGGGDGRRRRCGQRDPPVAGNEGGAQSGGRGPGDVPVVGGDEGRAGRGGVLAVQDVAVGLGTGLRMRTSSAE